jgi:signal peptidase
METKKEKISSRSKILAILLAAVLGINLYTAKTSNTLPMPFGYGMAVVLSNSMEPALVLDDLVVIKRTQTITAGDIIVYQSGDGMVIHRVVGYDGQTVTTQGDANNVADPPFDISAVKGKMVVRIPFIGRIVYILKTPSGIIMSAVIIFLLTELIGVIKEK